MKIEFSKVKIVSILDQIKQVLSEFGTEEDYFYGRVPKDFKIANSGRDGYEISLGGYFVDDVIVGFTNGFSGSNYAFNEYVSIVANDEFYICFSNEEFENDLRNCVKTYFQKANK